MSESTAVIELLVAGGNIDPTGDDVPMGENLVVNPVVVPAGTPIARPWLAHKTLPNPEYITGSGTVPDVPWQVIEWRAIHLNSQDNLMRAEYSYMEPSLRNALEDILLAQPSRPDGFRYDAPFIKDWQYRAEHVLIATAPFSIQGGKELTAGRGAWFEHPEDDSPCTPMSDDACNEYFSIFRIHKDGPLYEPNLYSSKDVSWLVFRRTTENNFNDKKFGELVQPFEPDPYEGTLLVRWRKEFETTLQRIAYRIDDEGRMRRRLGDEVDAAMVASYDDVPDVAPLDGTEPCQGAGVTCSTQLGYTSAL